MSALSRLSQRSMSLTYHEPSLQCYSSLDELIADVSPPVHIFKDASGSYVAEINLQGRPAILKIPHGRNRDVWERIATLVRPPNVEQQMQWRKRLLELNLNAPKTLITGVERRFGMVLHSFIIYEKVAGKLAQSESELAQISAALSCIHDAGYIRGDAHRHNYLIDSNGKVSIIDYRLRKPWVFPQGQMGIEKDKLIKYAPEVARFIDLSYQNTVSYQVMIAHKAVRRLSKRLFS